MKWKVLELLLLVGLGCEGSVLNNIVAEAQNVDALSIPIVFGFYALVMVVIVFSGTAVYLM